MQCFPPLPVIQDSFSSTSAVVSTTRAKQDGYLSDINLLAVIEGQDYEKSLQKIVSRFLSPNAHLDDLASLLTLDAKNIDVDKLGADAIKEQQRINLKFSSDQVAVIPEDHAQRMLAGVSYHQI